MEEALTQKIDELLRDANAWEGLIARDVRKPIQLIALGTAVRVRRGTAAVAVLTPTFAYEARPLLRTVFELHVNYAWMRMKRPNQRANRFLKFQPLERLRWAETLVDGSDIKNHELAPAIKAMKKRRSRLRHLFFDKRSKRWAKHWASVSAFEARLRQIARGVSDGGSFLYTLYRWFSSSAHGGAQSFEDILTRIEGGIRERPQAALDSINEVEAAAVLLLATWQNVAADFKMEREFREKLRTRLRTFLAELQADRLSSA